MSIYFLDSSALILFYVSEKGSQWVSDLFLPTQDNTILISRMTSLEVMAAIARQQRHNQITDETAKTVRMLLTLQIQQQCMVMSVSPTVTSRAEDLITRYDLYTTDSIQLASAMEANVRLITGRLPAITFVSTDQRLLTVAHQEGVLTAHPRDIER